MNGQIDDVQTLVHGQQQELTPQMINQIRINSDKNSIGAVGGPELSQEPRDEETNVF